MPYKTIDGGRSDGYRAKPDSSPEADAARMLSKAAKLARTLTYRGALTPAEFERLRSECVANIDAARARLAV